MPDKRAHFRSAVHAVILRGEERGQQEVLLGCRTQTGYCDGMYAFPVGHVEQFELITDAMAREMEEETGLTPAFNLRAGTPVSPSLTVEHLRDDGLDYPDANRFHHYFHHFFVVTQWNGIARNCEPNRCSDLRFFQLRQLPDNMMPLARHAIDCLLLKTPAVHHSQFGWDNPDFIRWQANRKDSRLQVM